MLAKMWKKVLLAICIIACIYNVMSKLINRTSLEANLNTANDGNTVFEIFKNDENEVINNTASSNTIEDVNNNENNVVEDTQETDTNEEEEKESSSSKAFHYTDYVILNQ
jgi:Na+-transporting methylmalonyl-CoA/oxaloacetate decarboxylase gamma subunit